jgi:hypothetical protein
VTALDYLGGVTTHTRVKAARALTFLESKGWHPTHFWGYDPNPANPEHHSRTAVDFMVFGNRTAGDQLAEWLWANASALGLKHLIWQRRIRSTVISPGVWRPMADRGSPTANHEDHIHAWFYDTAVRDATPASPIPTSLVKPAPTVSRAKTKALQVLLEVGADGLWGTATDVWAMRMRTAARAKAGAPRVVKPFNVALVQRVIDTTPDGVWGPRSQAALVAWVKSCQRLLGVSADGAWGPATDAAFFKLRTNNRNKF